MDSSCSPERRYAAAVMKVILGQVITNYDCTMVESDGPDWLTQGHVPPCYQNMIRPTRFSVGSTKWTDMCKIMLNYLNLRQGLSLLPRQGGYNTGGISLQFECEKLDI